MAYTFGDYPDISFALPFENLSFERWDGTLPEEWELASGSPAGTRTKHNPGFDSTRAVKITDTGVVTTPTNGLVQEIVLPDYIENGQHIRIGAAVLSDLEGSYGAAIAQVHMHQNSGAYYIRTATIENDTDWVLIDYGNSSSPISTSYTDLLLQIDIKSYLSGTSFNVTDATNASPIVITTSTVHGYSTGDNVRIADVLGNTAANGDWVITVLTTTTFSLDSSTGNGAYTSGGTATELMADPAALFDCIFAEYGRTTSERYYTFTRKPAFQGLDPYPVTFTQDERTGVGKRRTWDPTGGAVKWIIKMPFQNIPGAMVDSLYQFFRRNKGLDDAEGVHLVLHHKLVDTSDSFNLRMPPWIICDIANKDWPFKFSGGYLGAKLWSGTLIFEEV